MDAIFEHDLVEIDQQTQRFIQEFHVAEQLRFVDWKDLLDSLKLNNRQSGRLAGAVPQK
jgi:hypothetical protein